MVILPSWLQVQIWPLVSIPPLWTLALSLFGQCRLFGLAHQLVLLLSNLPLTTPLGQLSQVPHNPQVEAQVLTRSIMVVLGIVT